MPANPAKQFSIRELADEFHVTTRTLRFYEEKGLLQPTRDNATRIYSAADRTRLRLILRGKRLGFSLEESSAIVLMYEPDHGNREQLQTLIAKISEKQDQLENQKLDLEQMLDDLDKAKVRAARALKLNSNLHN